MSGNKVTWKVRLNSILTDKTVNITLPFPPFPGLSLRMPSDEGDFFVVGDVYWLEDEQRFDVFFRPTLSTGAKS